MAIGMEFIELMDSIGYQFRDFKNLECALTHTSYTNEMKARGIRVESNETLEFLGDAVLELVISEELFKKHGKNGEGTLTKLRQRLVCENTLAKIAAEIDLGRYLNIGSADEGLGLRASSKVLADALEAVIAAVYLDDIPYGGDRYKSVILNMFSQCMNDPSFAVNADYKTMLQQFVEKNEGSFLEYIVLEESGPEHNKTFKMAAYINNNEVGVGVGRTKKSAEMAAARRALELFGVVSNS